ncbi:hypothetical protein [Microvirga sp. M2]|uniref:hypothetical protein n=1 Tax=Microvirga sp. M2 TaxID=3073270 RepID=UPI0039C4E0BE
MKTKDDLIDETLQALGALGVGQAPSAEDRRDVESRIQPLLADLAARRVIYVADADAIDEAPFSYLVLVLAEHCAAKFGRPMDANAVTYGEDRLRTISRIGKGTGQSLTVDPALRRRC